MLLAIEESKTARENVLQYSDTEYCVCLSSYVAKFLKSFATYSHLIYEGGP